MWTVLLRIHDVIGVPQSGLAVVKEWLTHIGRPWCGGPSDIAACLVHSQQAVTYLLQVPRISTFNSTRFTVLILLSFLPSPFVIFRGIVTTT